MTNGTNTSATRQQGLRQCRPRCPGLPGSPSANSGRRVEAHGNPLGAARPTISTTSDQRPNGKKTAKKRQKKAKTRFCAVGSPTVRGGVGRRGRSHPAHPQGQCTTASPRSTQHGRGHSSASCRPSDRPARHRTSFGPPCSPSGRPRWHSLCCTCRRGLGRSPPQRDGTCRSAMSSGSRSARNAVQSHRRR